MFYATDMFPSRQKVYKDYKMYKPKMHKHDVLYGQKRRDRKKKTHTNRQKDNEIREIHCPSGMSKEPLFSF